MKFALKLYQTSPIRDAVVAQIAPTLEECDSDEALIKYIKDGCGCVYHPLGTAAMLPREDGGVVDPNLKVYGTANVRVVSIQCSARCNSDLSRLLYHTHCSGRCLYPSNGGLFMISGEA